MNIFIWLGNKLLVGVGVDKNLVRGRWGVYHGNFSGGKKTIKFLATGGDSPNLPSRENSATILSNLIKNDIL